MNAIIAARILTLVQSGSPMPLAFDAVLGQGAYDRFADDLYDTLRAQGEAK